MKTEQLKFSTLSYDDSLEAKERIFQIMLKAFLKLGYFTGESIIQSSRTYEEAPDVLAECADEGFKFNQKWEGEK